MLYGCDGHWWKQRNGVPEFKGLKISADHLACATYRDLHHVRLKDAKCPDMLFDEPGLIGSGGNSGHQTINLVAQFGVRGIVLVGFDMHRNGAVHWHGLHSKLNNPNESNFVKWRKNLNEAAVTLTKFGIEVVNASAESTVTAFPTMSIADALQRWRV